MHVGADEVEADGGEGDEAAQAFLVTFGKVVHAVRASGLHSSRHANYLVETGEWCRTASLSIRCSNASLPTRGPRQAYESQWHPLLSFRDVRCALQDVAGRQLKSGCYTSR